MNVSVFYGSGAYFQTNIENYNYLVYRSSILPNTVGYVELTKPGFWGKFRRKNSKNWGNLA